MKKIQRITLGFLVIALSTFGLSNVANAIDPVSHQTQKVDLPDFSDPCLPCSGSGSSGGN